MKKSKTIFLILVLFLLISFLPLRSQTLAALTEPHEGKSMRASSGNPFNNADSAKFDIGETKTIAVLKGPGKITHICLIPYSMDIRYPQALVLRIYWDGSEIPSVETPFGDFFAVGNGMRAIVNSLPVKVSSYGRGYNCYWQMPFQKEAKITITNESDKETASCYYQIDWVKFSKVPEKVMYFHASYHQEYSPEMGKPYTVFIGKGKGHYVGTVLSSQNGIGHWFGEGDDFFYIDGEETPSIIGTGTEDYINEAGESQIAGGYRVSLVNQLPTEKVNKTLDFFNIYQKDEHEDYIYGQRRERKIGLFYFNPGVHKIKLVCIGANPLSFNPETGKPDYNLSADVLSIRKIPFENMDAWIKEVMELEKIKEQK